MMTREEELLHLNNIATEIDEINSYTESMTYEDFTGSEDARLAVHRSLKNLGQAAEMLRSEGDWQKRYPDLDLDVLAQLQNATFEAPLELDQHGIWGIVSQDLQRIKESVYATQEQLERLEEEDNDLKGFD